MQQCIECAASLFCATGAPLQVYTCRSCYGVTHIHFRVAVGAAQRTVWDKLDPSKLPAEFIGDILSCAGFGGLHGNSPARSSCTLHRSAMLCEACYANRISERGEYG
jgi:hypothetical protein